MCNFLAVLTLLSLFSLTAHAESVMQCLVERGYVQFAINADLQIDPANHFPSGQVGVTATSIGGRILTEDIRTVDPIPLMTGYFLHTALENAILTAAGGHHIPIECLRLIGRGSSPSSFTLLEYNALSHYLFYNYSSLKFYRGYGDRLILSGRKSVYRRRPQPTPQVLVRQDHDQPPMSIILMGYHSFEEPAQEDEIIEVATGPESVEDLFRKALKKANHTFAEKMMASRAELRALGVL